MYIHYISLNCVSDSDFVMERCNGMADFLFLYIKTPSTIIIDNKIYTIEKPSLILIDSNVPFKYFPTGSKYVDDYLHFAVEDREAFRSELPFPLNLPIQVADDSSINDLLHQILKENNQSNKYVSQIVGLLIRLLMLKVSEQWDILQHEKTDIPHFETLLAIRDQILHSPEKVWTVEELATQAHLSHAYFQVMYKKAFGVTCFTDVINTKISQAKVLLSSTDFSVKRISEELGYKEVYHFIRQFKKHTGLTPGAFRKKIAKS
ncbi:MAG TPA: AraC family transcriptional regulator [Lachnospiraceae bacterium]|nr:AraC family transcriptional regulator [Lachnospiraceae bacterium]